MVQIGGRCARQGEAWEIVLFLLRLGKYKNCDLVLYVFSSSVFDSLVLFYFFFQIFNFYQDEDNLKTKVL